MKNSSNVNLDRASDFKLLDRKAIDALNEMPERLTFFRALSSWVGFKTAQVEFEVAPRNAGTTKWSFWKLFLYSLDGITAFSTIPLMIAAVVGVLFCILAFLMILFIIVRKLIFGDPVSGWPSLVCIMLFLSGIQFFCTGILGQYLAKTYMEVNNRPIYLTKEEF